MKNRVKILVTAGGGNLGRSMIHYLNTLPIGIIVADCSDEFLCAPKTTKRYLLPSDTNKNYFKELNKIIK
jgi:hypothetical protein